MAETSLPTRLDTGARPGTRRSKENGRSLRRPAADSRPDVKRSVNAISSALDQAIMHMDTDQYLYATSGEDFPEAIQAFIEKRKGVYKGN